jgi:hypothetical protein
LQVDCSQIESTIPTTSSPSDEESSNNQLPALPILLELVVRKTKDCRFSRISVALETGEEASMSAGACHYKTPRLTYSVTGPGRHPGPGIQCPQILLDGDLKHL